MRSYVGVVGIASRGEACACVDAWREAWADAHHAPARDLVLGVLSDAATMHGDVSSNASSRPRRSPKREDVASCMVGGPGVLPVLCYAGELSPHCTLNDHAAELANASHWAGSGCRGFQFDGAWPSSALLTLRRDIIAGTDPFLAGIGRRVFLQADPKMLSQMAAAASLSWKLDPYVGLATDVTMDAGDEDGWAIDAQAAAWPIVFIGERHPHLGVGIAGKLCADALTPVVGRMLRAGCSIQAGYQLCDGTDGGGRLDMGKVRAYFRATVHLLTTKDQKSDAG